MADYLAATVSHKYVIACKLNGIEIRYDGRSDCLSDFEFRARTQSTGRRNTSTQLGHRRLHAPSTSNATARRNQSPSIQSMQTTTTAANTNNDEVSQTQTQLDGPARPFSNDEAPGGRGQFVNSLRRAEDEDPEVCEKRQDDEIEQREALRILEKSSFVCTLYGSRQTGKRSIVKCLVKIVDEFRLAAAEYKREKILIKLLDCAERMQKLQAERQEAERQRQEQEAAAAAAHQSGPGGGVGGGSPHLRLDRKLSSAAQWIASEAMAKLRTSHAARYKRNHSMAVPPRQNQERGSSISSNGVGSMLQRADHLAPSASQSQRRHTEFGPPKLLIQGTCDDIVDESCAHFNPSADLSKQQRQDEFPESSASPTTPASLDPSDGKHGTFLTVCGDQPSNGSDSKIADDIELTTMIRVPSQRDKIENNNNVGAATSDLSNHRASAQPANSRQRARSNVHITLPLPAAQSEPRSLSFSFASPEQQQQQGHESSSFDLKCPLNQGEVFPCELEPTTNTRIDRVNELRQLLNLKQLNRRRVRVRFKSRRQLSSATVEALKAGFLNPALDAARYRQKAKKPSPCSRAPDCIILVYAVNDRASFEYAKMLIKKFKSCEQVIASKPTKNSTQSSNCRENQWSLPPIVLVANKIDLERSKVVKTEEGRSLAAKHCCKFIEISCTIGFNLDNLLAGLRTQLILRHHLALNSLFKLQEYSSSMNHNQKTATGSGRPKRDAGNNGHNRSFVRRLFKRYLAENDRDNDYDCDNFYKL